MNLREVAQSLRIDPSTFENGQVVDTSVAVPDVETFRKLFGGTLSDEHRAAFSAATVSPGSESEIANHAYSAWCCPLTSAFTGEPVRINPGATVVTRIPY